MQLLTNASAASYQSTFIIWQIHMQLLNNLYADSDKLKSASNKVNEASDKSTCRFRKFIYNFRWIHGWAWILDRVGLLGGGDWGTQLLWLRIPPNFICNLEAIIIKATLTSLSDQLVGLDWMRMGRGYRYSCIGTFSGCFWPTMNLIHQANIWSNFNIETA